MVKIDALIAEIHHKFGYGKLKRVSELVKTQNNLSTGIASLDELLRGGLLVGSTHNIIGQATSGATSLLYQVIAGVQTSNIPILYLDMVQLFDPPNAANIGIEVEKLLLINPTTIKHMLFLIHTLARHRLPCLVVIDNPSELPLTQLNPMLRKNHVTLLVLSSEPLKQMRISLLCKRQRWHYEYGDVTSFTSKIHLKKHPFIVPSSIQMTFDVPKEDERG